MEIKKTTDETIKPCPFCGMFANLYSVYTKYTEDFCGFKISCARCGTSTKLYINTEDCVEAWNTRV